MGSSSKRAPVPHPLSFGGASPAATGTPTPIQGQQGQGQAQQQQQQQQQQAEQYEQYQQYQQYQEYQAYEAYQQQCQQQTQQTPQDQDPYRTPDYSQYSTSPPSYYTSQGNTPGSASGEYFPQQGSGGSRRKSSRSSHHSRNRKCSSPTVNNYTYCGRHSNEWLFGGHGFSDIAKIFKKDEKKDDEENQPKHQ